VSRAYLFEVTTEISSDWNAPLFTGKFVKSLLIDANPALKDLFKKSTGKKPKLIHITPLYEIDNRKMRCVYSSAEVGEKGIFKIRPVKINGLYKFYVGFVDIEDDLLTFDKIYGTLMEIPGKHIFANHAFEVELTSLKALDVEREAKKVVEDLLSKGTLRVTFASPTLLRDPFRPSKFKSLIPTPMNVFSTPIFINLWLRGEAKRRPYYTMLVMIHRLLNETHSIYSKHGLTGTVQVKFLAYEAGKSPIPSLIGYVNYKLNHHYMQVYEKANDVKELLKDLFELMLTLGTGTSRATGFGHITLHPSGRHLTSSNDASGEVAKAL
jgi:CRISPR/Cas system endoribonuclease Cas6 (RAMP superfamily)